MVTAEWIRESSCSRIARSDFRAESSEGVVVVARGDMVVAVMVE